MYRVIETFRDMRDGRLYLAGDPYPRSGVEVSAERLAELSGTGNKQHRPMIRLEKPKEASQPKEEKPQEEKPVRKRTPRKKKE